MRTTMKVMAVEPRREVFPSWRALRLYVRVRRNGTLHMAAAIALGILFMMIHWG